MTSGSKYGDCQLYITAGCLPPDPRGGTKSVFCAGFGSVLEDGEAGELCGGGCVSPPVILYE